MLLFITLVHKVYEFVLVYLYGTSMSQNFSGLSINLYWAEQTNIVQTIALIYKRGNSFYNNW